MSSLIRRRPFFGIGVAALAVALAAFALVALAAPEGTAAAPAKPNVMVLSGTGVSLQGGYVDPASGKTCPIYLSVDPGGTPKSPEAYLNLEITAWDPEAWECQDKECTPPPPEEMGACALKGVVWHDLIPSGDFTSSGQRYTLRTTAMVIPWSECIKGGCPEGEEPDPIATSIDVTWQRTPVWESMNSGIYAYRGEGFLRRESGTSFQYSASAEGTIGGTEVLTSGGEYWGASLRTFRSTTVCRAPADMSYMCEYGGER